MVRAGVNLDTIGVEIQLSHQYYDQLHELRMCRIMYNLNVFDRHRDKEVLVPAKALRLNKRTSVVPVLRHYLVLWNITSGSSVAELRDQRHKEEEMDTDHRRFLSIIHFKTIGTNKLPQSSSKTVPTFKNLRDTNLSNI